MATVDTTCLRALGGTCALEEHAQNTWDPAIETASKQMFKEVDPQAPVNSQGQRVIEAGIAGVSGTMRFELVDKEIPMFISLNQLRDLGALIHVKDVTIDFENINKFGVSLHILQFGHLALDITGTRQSGVRYHRAVKQFVVVNLSCSTMWRRKEILLKTTAATWITEPPRRLM